MDDALKTVCALLGTRVEQVEQLSAGDRSTVRRIREAHGDRTLIVKEFHGAGEPWVRECAALACLPADAPAPRLVAESADPQLAVLSDLGGGGRRSVRTRGIADHLLADDSAAAAGALVRWARALAALHGATRGLRGEFESQLAARAGDLPVAVSPLRADLASAGELLDRHCAALGVATPPGTADQLRELAERVTSGPTALSPHDTCPDNCVAVGDELALVDFEGAQWRNVAWDLAYLVVPWPTCWCCWRLAEPAADAAVAAYRESAAQAFPEVATAEFDRDLEAAVLGWALESAALLIEPTLAGEDRHSGDPDRDRPAPPRRSVLLHRLDRASAVSVFPALAELTSRLAADLRDRWGAQPALPLAPAFRE